MAIKYFCDRCGNEIKDDVIETRDGEHMHAGCASEYYGESGLSQGGETREEVMGFYDDEAPTRRGDSTYFEMNSDHHEDDMILDDDTDNRDALSVETH